MKLIMVLFLVFLGVIPLHARVIYVDQAGGGDVETIQKGLNVAEDGDTVLVAKGLYWERSLEFHGKAILLRSESGATETVIRHNVFEIFYFVSQEDTTSIVEGFTIEGEEDGYHPLQGVTCLDASPTIRNNIIRYCGDGVLCSDGAKPRIINDIIYRNDEIGVRVQRSAAPTIEGNLIYENGSEGILAGSGVTVIKNNIVIANGGFWGIDAEASPIIEGNLLVGNKNGIRMGQSVKNNVLLNNEYWGIQDGVYTPIKQNNLIAGSNVGMGMDIPWSVVMENNVITGCGTGILIDGSEDPHVVRNNIVINNGWGVYFLSGLHGIDLSYNDVWNNTIGDYHGCTPGEGSVSMDPEFVDPANNHFALSSTSPLIDLGDPSILDPDSTRSDMGAYGGPGALPFALTLLPRDTILTRGEDNLLYDLILSNTTGLTQEVQAWTEVILSSRKPYPGNPMVGPVSLHLNPYQTLMLPNPISHPVPRNAPTGIYEYQVLLGDPLGDIMTDSRFYFLILP